MPRNLTFKQIAVTFALASSLLGTNASSAATISLDQFAGGWKSTYDPSGPDPRPYPCPINVCPNIVDSGAAFEAAMPGWNDVGFDDSAWSSYAPDGGSNWDPADGSVTPFYLRKMVTITGTPTSGHFFIVVDDDYRVWVNGTLVPALDDHSYGCCQAVDADISSFLQGGDNVIAIKAENAPGGGYSIAFTGSIEFDPQVLPDPPTVPEPASLALLSLGFVGLGLSRRRKS